MTSGRDERTHEVNRTDRTMTRRQVLGLAGGVAATGIVPAFASRAMAQGVNRPGGELVVGFSIDPGHMDPRVEAGVPGWSIFHNILDPFIWRDPKINPVPWLVTKWEQVNPTTLRWHLRKGVKFHNGEDFTAESVKVSFEQYAAPNSRSPYRSQLNVVKQFKIADPHTVDLITERPNRPLLRNSTQAMAISPRALRELGDRFPTNPVGTGQMKFVEYRPGQHVLMEANPGYWGKKSSFARLRIRFIPENGTRLAALEAGEVMMVNNVPPDQISRLRANQNLHVISIPSNRVIFVTLRTDRKPFNDKRVRQAMNYAIDREAITKGIFGGMAPIARAPLPEGVFGFHDGLTPYPYDPERAKKLLAEAGATGATFNFGVPNGRYLMDKQVGEAIAGYLDAVGIKVAFENPAWSTFVSEVTKFEKAKYDGYMFGWGIVTAEPDQLMGEHFYSPNARRTLLKNDEVDRLLVEARENFDDAKVKAAYRKAQEILWDECPWIWLYEQPDITAIHKKLRGFAGRRDEYLMFWDASLES
jgi:peptide/nickel transport system substrate-binding protein